MNAQKQISRRQFLGQTALLTGALAVPGCASPRPRRLSANEKLNIAVIGTINRAQANLNAIKDENIVALCDVDSTLLGAAAEKYPSAKCYQDFRKMLERRDIDAVVVSATDHTHAVMTAAALQSGRHVYCEKPLTHTVYEARQITRLAARHPRLATQMGTQIHATENYHRTVELVRAGAIGPVHECHVWCEKSLPEGERPREMVPIPDGLDWDLWLGPAPARPYNPAYLPKTWRRWWDFGEGILGDMVCHYMDLAFWSLDLKYPTSVVAEGPPPHPETVPPWMIVHYEFPARAHLPPLKLSWYDGGKRPNLGKDTVIPDWRNGVLFVGSKGMLVADYGRHQLLPEKDFANHTPPAPSIPKSPGHQEEWILACKHGGQPSCNFAYAGPLTEAVLLGIVSYRAGERLDWNSRLLKATNRSAAANFLRREYRRGWSLNT